MRQKYNIKLIEKKILPLVVAINKIKHFKTFSSCEGHFDDDEQQITDRNHADVRFDLLKSGNMEFAENFMRFVITEFGNGAIPAFIQTFKLYVPKIKNQSDFVFVIQIAPINRFENPKMKRKYTDIGIKRATRIVNRFIDKNEYVKS